MVNDSFLEIHKTLSMLRILKSPTDVSQTSLSFNTIFLANLSTLCKTEFFGTLWFRMLVCMPVYSLDYDFFDSENCILLIL